MDKIYKKYFESYLYYLNFEKKLGKGTIGRYREELECFFEFLEENYENNFETLQNEKIIKQYIYKLVAIKNNVETTVNRKISTLRQFFIFILTSKDFPEIKLNPMLNVKNQKVTKKLPVYLTLQECEKFLYGIKFFSRYALRDYALFNVFLATGARLSEISQLKLSQVNLDSGIIKIYGKGRKERLVALTDSALEALKKYVESGYNKDVAKRGRIPKIDTDIVFLNKYGKPYTSKGIYMLFISLTKKIGIYKKGLSPHKLRHTFATLLKASGADIVELKKLLGHSSLSSTQIYMHVSDDDVLRKVKNIHPLNRKNVDDEFIERIKKQGQKWKK